jgi:flagellar biogenesis protein FliO
MALIEQLTAIAGVLALLAATLWWLRRGGFARFQSGRPRRAALGQLEQLARLPLTPQHSLHLVRLAGRALLIGRSPAGLTVLESVEWKTGSVAPTESPE